MAPPHHGVVAIITSVARTRFFVQQKDEDYRPFPLGYSLFGGAAEPGESLPDALTRELREELGPAAQPLVEAGLTHVLTTHALQAGFVVSLFEVVLDEEELESLGAVEVLEGKRGVLMSRDQLRATPLIWGLHEVVAEYLEGGR